MTRIDERDLVLISGAGGNQEVEPSFGQAASGSSTKPEPPYGTNPPSDDLVAEGANSGGTQNLQ